MRFPSVSLIPGGGEIYCHVFENKHVGLMRMTVDFLGFYGGDENPDMMVNAEAELPFTGLLITPENLQPTPVNVAELKLLAADFVDLTAFREPERRNRGFILRPLSEKSGDSRWPNSEFMSPHCLRTWRCASTGGAFSPGWYVCLLVRVQLSAEEWEVPGLVAMVNYGRKKQCEVRDEVFQGPPNFVLDVFDAADDENYLRRRDRFSRYGVHEYVAILNDDPKALAWHRLDAGGYRSIEPDDDGIFRSEALPNFWVPLNALRDRDWWTVLGCIERGVSRRANFS